MERIAITHYTALPAIGGVENLIEQQIRLLRGMGHDVRLIVGSGSSQSASDVVIEPLLDPTHAAVREVGARSRGDLALAEHPLFGMLQRSLSAMLEGWCQCWVHNILTLDLHPILSSALFGLMKTRKDVGWAAWCHDISARSAFRFGDRAPGFTVHEDLNLSCATISNSRRVELSAELGLKLDEIAVISPPIDAFEWLDVGAEARLLAEVAALDNAEPIVVVPSKLLPHKNLDAAIDVAVRLREIVPSPRLLLTAAQSAHEPAASSILGNELRRRAREGAVADVVIFAPDVLGVPLTQRGVRDLMLLADAVWMPSIEEGYGLPAREASLFRVPVLCSDIPAFRELQSEGVHLLRRDSPEAIARRLLSLARSAENRGRRNTMQSMRIASKDLEKFVEAVRLRRDAGRP